jgi:glutamine amidotransferase
MVLAHTTHGERFVSAVAQGSVAGVQFHPERSGRDGLRLLANFVGLVRSPGAAGSLDLPTTVAR